MQANEPPPTPESLSSAAPVRETLNEVDMTTAIAAGLSKPQAERADGDAVRLNEDAIKPQFSADFRTKYPHRKYPELKQSLTPSPGLPIPPASTRYQTAVNILKELENDQMEPIFPSAETPEYAAVLSRLDPTKMSLRECLAFPDILQSDANAVQRYLQIRNILLQLWHLNPKEQLGLEGALAFFEVQEEFAEKSGKKDWQEHVLKILRLLDRMCLINYGLFNFHETKSFSFKLINNRHRIVVVGAGVAGLMAARKLQQWGFDVEVHEGRARAGGRLHTWKGEKAKEAVAELGAMIITGLEGNPLYTMLYQQLGVELERIGGRCPLFNSRGYPVAKFTDEILEVEFNTLLSAASKSGRGAAPGSLKVPPSLGEGLSFMVKREELECLRRAREFKENQIDMIKTLKLLYKDQKTLTAKLATDKEKYIKAKTALAASNTSETQWAYRTSQSDMLITADKLTDLNDKLKLLEAKSKVATKQTPPGTYLDAGGRAVIAWHEANLEFANANHLDCLSLQHWDQDDEYELPGGHFSVPSGLNCLVDALSKDLKIYYDYCVCAIHAGTCIARVEYFNQCTRNTVEDLSAVLCTVPLGVLKKSVANVHEPKGRLKGVIHFYPSLPEEKLRAIEAMGYGVLNKVILTYKTRFWQAKRALFGFVNEDVQRRGEFFLFWSLYEEPTLVALIAGEAAVALQEEYTKEEVVAACQETLRRVFGEGIEEPVEAVVTKWGQDIWSCGSYSSVGPAASGANYDVLAEPLPNAENPVVFFAGEHTIRNYPATVHGAVLSGLREATRIADKLDKLWYM